MSNYKIVVMCVLLLSTSAFALQIKNAVDNETVTAKISSLDPTRIVVEGDRIKSVKGIKGAYERENDDLNGEIFVTPIQKQAFTLLIETEQGRHFNLLLNPLPVPGDTLMLVPKGVGRQQAERFEKASDYDSTLVHLMQIMSNGMRPDGYKVIQMNSKQGYSVGKVATLKLKTLYQGYLFQGEIFELVNTQTYPITLNERTFYKKGTRAISLEKITVLPKEKIRVLRVSTNG